MNDAEPLDREACERARLTRDPRFDGRFFVGVVTTGIYCRPVCPVQPPRRRNVRIFVSAAAAASAGFRPCLRCRPEAAPGSPAWRGTSTTVSRALALIDDGALEGGTIAGGTVEALAERLGIGSRHLERLFAKHLGASPAEVARTRRLHFAKRLIDETDLPMTEVALAAGFGSVRRFNACIRQTYARTPSQLRRLSRGAHASTDGVRLRLALRPPLAFDAMLAYLAARAVVGVECVTNGEYRRTIRSAGGLGHIAVRRIAQDALELEVRGIDAQALMATSERVRRMFDLGTDPHPIASHLSRDGRLRRCSALLPGARPVGGWCPFEIAVRAVLGQGVRVSQATTLATRLAHAFGPLRDESAELGRLFPEAEDLIDADIERIGVPTTRARTLRALAAAVVSGRVCFDAPVADVVVALHAIPGIGPWTSSYVALRGLGDPDAFPAEDAALRRLAQPGSRLAARELAARAERWRPWRSYAAAVLWHAGSLVP